MRSFMIDTPFWIEQCRDMFGFDESYNGPDVMGTNTYFGGLDITGSNIIFLNAGEDPWQWASMREPLHNPDLQKDMVAKLIDCENCGHCVDLHAPSPNDSKNLTDARTLIETTIRGWLGIKENVTQFELPHYPEDDSTIFLQ